MFGERAILENKVRAIDIVASHKSLVFNVDPELFLKVSKNLHPTIKIMNED